MKRMKQKMDEQRNFFSRNRLSVNYICGQFGRKSVDVTGSPATMLVNVSLPKGEGGEARKLRLRIGFQYSREEDLERDMRKRKRRKMFMVEGNSADLLRNTTNGNS